MTRLRQGPMVFEVALCRRLLDGVSDFPQGEMDTVTFRYGDGDSSS